MRILFLGDLVGKRGLTFLKEKLPFLKSTYKPNLIFLNAENTTNGKGLSQADYKELMKLNIAALSMGNHTYRNREINDFIDDSKICRPLNALNVKGKGYIDIKYNDKTITLINLIGTFMLETEFEKANPFTTIDTFLQSHHADYYLVDMHAEATSEHLAMGYFLDGRVNAILGTHTHVQTNDARVLPKGSLYITDLGMCGPLDGILGVKKEIIINRFWQNDLSSFKLEDSGKCQLNGVLLELDGKPTIKIIHLEN